MFCQSSRNNNPCAAMWIGPLGHYCFSVSKLLFKAGTLSSLNIIQSGLPDSLNSSIYHRYKSQFYAYNADIMRWLTFNQCKVHS